MKKPRSDAKLKTLHPAAQKRLWDFLQEAGNSYDPQGIAFVKKEFGLSTSEGALSGWWEWYPLARELSETGSLLDDLKIYLKENPDIDLDSEQLSKAGQVIMEKRALKAADPKHFIAMRRLRLSERNLDLEMQKYRNSLETKIEAGLNALHTEIRGNAEAEQLFTRIRAIVRKGVKATK
jgi:hypothetical protein